MKYIIRVLLLAVVVLLGWWAWTVFFPNPKAQIRKRLNELEKVASFSTTEAPLAKLANANKLAEFFADKVQVKVDAGGLGERAFESREELTQAALAMRNYISAAKVHFSNSNIEVPPGALEAIVDLYVNADVGGDKNSFFEEMKFNYRKIDGKWLITRVESVKTLR